MSGVTESADEPVRPSQVIRLCEECGYDLHGLDTGGACPECGTVIAAPGTSAEVQWQRAVSVGLFLLLWVTMYGIESVLVQRFTGTLGGILPALNMPGPKLWVEPLLQRPIGTGPEVPGIVGTRAAFISLFAVWLITVRPPVRKGGDGPSTLRLFARWGAVIPFGFFFGIFAASQGIWPQKLPPYRLCILVFAELPSAALLYAYLAVLSQSVLGRERRRTFDHLRWAVPATIGLAIFIAAGVWYLTLNNQATAIERYDVLISGTYGVISLICALIATVAVASLMLAFASMGFANFLRIAIGVRRAVVSAWQQGRRIDEDRLRRTGVAIGLILFVVVAVFGNDRILWYDTRQGLAGNLPYFNFPGPKLWVAAAVPQLGYVYAWNSIVSHTTLTVLNLSAVWLMTVNVHRDGRDKHFRRVVRWVPFAAIGIAIGCAGGWRGGHSEELGSAFRSEFFAGVMVLCEVPATVLLYLYAAHIAGTVARRPRLSTLLVAVGLFVPVLAGLAMAAFSLSSEHRAERFNLSTLAACGAAGAGAFIGAAWAVISLLSLAGTLLRSADERPAEMVKDNISAPVAAVAD